MNLISGIKEFFAGVKNKVFGVQTLEKAMNVHAAITPTMDKAIRLWNTYYCNSFTPARVSMRMPTTVATEAARLATVELGIEVSGSPRADWLNEQMQKFNGSRLRHGTEYGCALGGAMFMPTLTGSISVVRACDFIPTDYNDGEVWGAMFPFRVIKGETYYTRIEYHRFEGDTYIISNKAFRSRNASELGVEVALDTVPEWAEIQPDVNISALERPLWGYFRAPFANDVDTSSPLGVSIYARALSAFDDLDEIYKLFRSEVHNSHKKVFVSSAILPKATVKDESTGKQIVYEKNPIPDLIQGMEFLGQDADSIYHEYNPEIRIDDIRKTMQTALDIIGNQCGFSDGYFSFDENTGTITTATEVEADQQRTISTVTDIQKSLQVALDGLLYALNAMADLYGLAPGGEYEVAYAFKDLSVNITEDRARAWQMVNAHIIPAWLYLVQYEGYSEEDAKRTVAEAKADEPKLFEE